MENIWEKPCMYSPSLICLDLCNLESQVRQVEQSGIEMLHVDILDGHFSPSMPLGLDTVRQLRAKTNLAFDCHVMVTEQDYFVDELLDIGVQQVVFHAETQPHIDGYAFVKGEKQVVYADRKIRELRRMIDERGLPTKIELDGRISQDNIRAYGKDTVEQFVVGSTCIKRDRMAESLHELDCLRREVIGG